MGRSPGTSRRWMPYVGSFAASGVGLGLVACLPLFVGVSWSSVGSCLAGIPALVLVGLVVLWFAGLLVHVPVLMAAMSGLTVRQALTLNLSGSAVSNVLPLGGPAGMGLGYAMARSWGFSPERFASYTVATNLWNALGKFVMGLSVLAAAAVLGVRLPGGLGPIVISAAAFITVGVGAGVATFRTRSSTAAVGRLLDAFVCRIRPGTENLVCTSWLLSSRLELVRAIRAGWMRMSFGVAFYLVLQGALLFACLAAAGASATVTAAAIAFAIERLISLAPLTPGAAGVAELGTVAALGSMGVPLVSAAGGVLLYRILMFAVEIPVGGVLALNWVRTRRRYAAWPTELDPESANAEGAATPSAVAA